VNPPTLIAHLATHPTQIEIWGVKRMEQFSTIDRMVDDFGRTVCGAGKVLIVSADGHPLSGSMGSQEETEHMAARVSVLVSVADGCAGKSGLGECKRTLLDMDRGYLVVMRVGAIARIAVVAESGTDLERLDTEMTLFSAALEDELTHSFSTRMTGEIGPFIDSFPEPVLLPQRNGSSGDAAHTPWVAG
jgi:uncharacterized protein